MDESNAGIKRRKAGDVLLDTTGHPDEDHAGPALVTRLWNIPPGRGFKSLENLVQGVWSSDRWR